MRDLLAVFGEDLSNEALVGGLGTGALRLRGHDQSVPSREGEGTESCGTQS